jgi:hypothetical protein
VLDARDGGAAGPVGEGQRGGDDVEGAALNLVRPGAQVDA